MSGILEDPRTSTNGIAYNDLLRTGPGTLAGRYLRRYWQPVYRGEDINPGQAKPIRIMSEDFTLYRGETGTAHVIADRCAHRGAKLSIGWVEGDSIRCAYHGWQYDATGQCVAQPAEPKPFCEKVKVRAYPTQEYLGLIFAYFGEGQPPEMPRLPEYENHGYLENTITALWPCNYITQIENTLDYAHTAFLHPHFNYKVPENLVAEETSYGLKTYAAGLSGVAGTYETGHLHMPNAQEFMAAPMRGEKKGFFSRSWRVPRDDESFVRFDLWRMPLTGKDAEDFKARHPNRAANWPASIPTVAQDFLDGKRALKDLANQTEFNWSDLTQLQDCIVLMSLEPMLGREHHEGLGRTDMGIALMRRLWTRELQALAEGRPLTQWQRPDYLWSVATQ